MAWSLKGSLPPITILIIGNFFKSSSLINPGDTKGNYHKLVSFKYDFIHISRILYLNIKSSIEPNNEGTKYLFDNINAG